MHLVARQLPDGVKLVLNLTPYFYGCKTSISKELFTQNMYKDNTLKQKSINIKQDLEHPPKFRKLS